MTENIRKLSEKEKVRDKISVWLGASNNIAVMHTIRELIGNSVDEVNRGNGDKIKVVLKNDKRVVIEDNCNGLPFEGIGDGGVENYKLITQHLFAGTKYDNGLDNEDYTVGTNGLFLCVLTYSSYDIEFTVGRPDGNIYNVSYHKGDEVEPMKIIGKTDKTFTRIEYTLDDDIYEENYFGVEELNSIASEQASLIDGSIVFENEMTGESFEYKYEEGIKEYLEDMTSGMKKTSDIILFNKDISEKARQDGKEVVDDMKISIALSYTQEDEDLTQIEFLNGSNLIHHGTIYDGLVSGLRTIINRYLRDNDMYKKDEKQVTREDILVGLNYVIDFKSYFPVYANQTKFASYVKYYEPIMRQVLEELFESYIIENKFDMEKIANQILVNKRSRESAEKTRLNVRKKLSGSVNNITNKVEGFYNCKSKDKSKNILAICEGKSALSSLLSGRRDVHAIFPIRGKILNCLKASVDRSLGNDVIVNLMKVLGCGVEIGKDKKYFNIDNLNFSKIYIYVDQDHDGIGSILPLLLTVFWKLTPTLVKEGRIYLVETPKYEVTIGKDEYYATSDEKLEVLKEQHEGKNMTINYIKGLAELSEEAMAMCLEDGYENIRRITLDNIEESIETLEVFMGTDSTKRREVILDSFDEVDEE